MSATIIEYTPIGIIHTPFKKSEGTPIQPRGADGIEGTIDIYQEYKDGLQDLDGFSHIILIYHFHLSLGYSLRVVPFMDTTLHGVFATRAPKRPNPIGISVVQLLKIEDTILTVSGVDIIDGTPLLDIKPYVVDFDNVKRIRIGWLRDKKDQVRNIKADDRF